MNSRKDYQEPIRLTNQHFQTLRFVFFEYCSLYSIVKIETLLNKSFSETTFFKNIDLLRLIYEEKNNPDAKIMRSQLAEIVVNIHSLYEKINIHEFYQSMELAEGLKECSFQINKVLSDFRNIE